MSKVVQLDKITTGMVLGAPILNRYGQTLLAAGIVLEEKHLMMFKTWGIKHVTVDGGNSEPGTDKVISEDLMNLARAHVEKRLLWNDFLPIEKDLIDAAVERAVDLFSEQQPEGAND